MTPQQKAKELIDKFMEFADDEYFESSKIYELGENRIKNSKQCALICVDEIIELIRYHSISGKMSFNYWQQIRNEIINYK